jgi:hypothetical protein
MMYLVKPKYNRSCMFDLKSFQPRLQIASGNTSTAIKRISAKAHTAVRNHIRTAFFAGGVKYVADGDVIIRRARPRMIFQDMRNRGDWLDVFVRQ